MKIRPVGAEFFHADEQTDMTQLIVNTVIPRLTKIIRSGITFVSRNLR